MDHTIVIGIDFGTTFSGVAFAYSGQPDDISVITSWDTEYNQCSDSGKVPTLLEFNFVDDIEQWGYGIPPGKEVLQWFKLLLLKEEDVPLEVSQTKQYKQLVRCQKKIGASPVDLVACFLRFLWKHALEQIDAQLGSTLSNVCRFHIVFTVPAIWPHYVQDNMMKAASLAGLFEDRDAGVTSHVFMSEPEAAALAALLKMKNRPDIKEGDTLVICDAGGGTADLISYVIDSTNPLKISECVAGKGGLCGGIFVDHNFENLVASKIGEKDWYKISVEDRRGFINDFWEYRIKRQFGKSDRMWPVQVPESTSGAGSLGKRKRSITISLTTQELDGVFSPVVEKICGLVNDQVESIGNKDLPPPTFIILVGGFGSCHYLYKTLRDGNPNCTVRQATGGGSDHSGWTAICRGAVMYGLMYQQSSLPAPVAIQARVSRYNYGVDYSQLWNGALHSHQDKYLHPQYQKYYAKNQMQWFLKKGTILKVGQKSRHTFAMPFFDRIDEREERLYYSASDELPARKDDSVKELCAIKWKQVPGRESWTRLRNKSGEYYFQFEFTIEVTVNGPMLSVEVKCDGETMADGTVAIRFD